MHGRSALVVVILGGLGGLAACGFEPAGAAEPDGPVIGSVADGGVDAAVDARLDAPVDAAPLTAPPGYTPADDPDADDAWYRAVPVAAPMALAAADCADDGPGAALIIIEDDDGNARMFARMRAQLDGRRSWLGITDADEEDVWRTVRGGDADFVAWNDGEPNDAGAVGEDCAIVLGRFDPENAQGAWNDVDCAELRPYVCQWRPR